MCYVEKMIISFQKRKALFKKKEEETQYRLIIAFNQEPERDCGCGSESGNTRKEKNFVIVEDKKR